ncbi:MAG TPA: DUF58 domain-containing protein [Candidatus Baltobacteraceae bacterium]
MNSAIRNALLAGRRRPVVRGGTRPYPRRGDGFEIAELRGYVDGDDPRRIDWAATARAGGLQVRVLLEEHALCFAAIVDDSASLDVGRTRTLRTAAYEALDAWADALAREDRGARILSDAVDAPRLLGARAASRLRERREIAAFDLDSALRLARAALPRDSALLVVSDFYARLDVELLREIGAFVDSTALIAHDPWADGMPLHGFVNLRDAESGATRSIFLGGKSRRRFRDAVARRERELAEQFASCGWRAGLLNADDGAASLDAAFGI